MIKYVLPLSSIGLYCSASFWGDFPSFPRRFISPHRAFCSASFLASWQALSALESPSDVQYVTCCVCVSNVIYIQIYVYIYIYTVYSVYIYVSCIYIICKFKHIYIYSIYIVYIYSSVYIYIYHLNLTSLKNKFLLHQGTVWVSRYISAVFSWWTLAAWASRHWDGKMMFH